MIELTTLATVLPILQQGYLQGEDNIMHTHTHIQGSNKKYQDSCYGNETKVRRVMSLCTV